MKSGQVKEDKRQKGNKTNFIKKREEFVSSVIIQLSTPE